VARSADEVADLNAAAARIGVQGNRYSDLNMGLVGRSHYERPVTLDEVTHPAFGWQICRTTVAS
jgi:hypothetical protein